ncbi:MAG: NF038104 family lipoprotein [Gammaproteobacteria bacterium]
MSKILIITFALLSLQGCLGTLVGTAADVVIETAKIPFKVTGAAIDLMTDDEKEEKGKDD